MAPSLPSGHVTFLFTDIEGSTRLWERDAAAMRGALDRHNVILDEAIASHGGVHFKTTGDAFQAAFPTPERALAAAVAAQQELAREIWPETGPIRVRMGLHLGEAHPDASGDYLAPCLNRLARLLAVGYGGQVLLSEAVRHAIQPVLPAHVTLRDLGRHRLRDLLEPECVTQLVIADLPDTFPPLKSLEGFATNLPVLPTALIGRQTELATLAAHLEQGDRLVSLLGPGGVGKTHLALQAAADALPRFADGVWLVPLGEIVDPDLVLPRIAAILGIREGGGLDLRAALVAYLANKRALIVLDNVEQVTLAASVIVDLLASCPLLQLLITSRRRLRIAGERTLMVEPLPLPAVQASLASVRESPAVQLFVERATSQDPAFVLHAANVEAVASICAQLDGLPLAIELAAAQIAHYTLSELLRALDDRFHLLTAGRRDALSHQQTLEATIAWSYDGLTAAEQEVLRTLSVFAGGWNHAAAAAVLETGKDLLAVSQLVSGLVEGSLVRRTVMSNDESRWSMLASIRAFGQLQLDAAGEMNAACDRHATWCLTFSETAAAALEGSDQALWLDRLEQEHDNARAALRWTKKAAQPARHLAIASCLAQFWEIRGYLTEGRRWLEGALTGTGCQGTEALTAMIDAGILAQVQGDSNAAATWWERALHESRARSDRGREAAILTNLGVVALWQGQLDDAERSFNDGLTIAHELGDRRRHLTALGNLAAVAQFRGDVTMALARYTECLALWRELDDANGIAAILLNIVQLLAPLPEHAGRARTAGEEALRRYRELRNPQGEALVLTSLGTISALAGDLERAVALHRESLARFRDIEDFAGESRAHGNLGTAALDDGDLATASEHLARALELAVAVGERDGSVYWLEGLAALRVAEGHDTLAARLYGAVEALREQIDIPQPLELRERFEAHRALLRQRLGAEFARVWKGGRLLSLTDAVAEGLAHRALPSPGPAPAASFAVLDDLIGFASVAETPTPARRL